MFYPVISRPDFDASIAATRSTPTPEVETLKGEIERLLIITEALWAILKEKHGYEENEIVKQMVMIDMRDGKLDGKVAASAPRKCPKCDRVLHKKRPRCLYCGEPIAPEPFDR